LRKSKSEKPELKEQEEELKRIANKRYEEKIQKEKPAPKSRPDLVENFHWVLMRVRRMKGLTQAQFAEKIGESEAAIKLAEQGIVPEGYELMDKFEKFFEIKLIEKRDPEFSPPQKPLDFKDKNLDNLTIADLQRIKEERESKSTGEAPSETL
jgi:ribosome-binding protein aMBF1 (putative translation factor)